MLTDWETMFPEMFKIHGRKSLDLDGLPTAAKDELAEMATLMDKLGAELYWQDDARTVLGLTYQDEAKAAENMEAVERLDKLVQEHHKLIMEQLGDQLSARAGPS